MLRCGRSALHQIGMRPCARANSEPQHEIRRASAHFILYRTTRSPHLPPLPKTAPHTPVHLIDGIALTPVSNRTKVQINLFSGSLPGGPEVRV